MPLDRIVPWAAGEHGDKSTRTISQVGVQAETRGKRKNKVIQVDEWTGVNIGLVDRPGQVGRSAGTDGNQPRRPLGM